MRIAPAIGIAALAAALAASPAEAAQTSEPWGRAGPWDVLAFGQGDVSPPRPVPGPPAPPTGGRARSQPARAPASLVTYFSSDDYPAAALRAREEGPVGFRLEIDRTGRVSACAITSSSGSAALDSTTCALLVRRARFIPARDAKGRAVADSVRGRIVWRLPASQPPPTLP
jgi:TonB family protein